MNRAERRRLGQRGHVAKDREPARVQPRIVAISFGISAEVSPWERELLLAHLQELLEAVLATPGSDEEE